MKQGSFALHVLLALNIFIFIVLKFGLVPESLLDLFSAHSIASDEFKIWQPLTYSFIHFGLWHIGINMFVFWTFTRNLTSILNSSQLFILYFFSAIVSYVIFQVYSLLGFTGSTLPPLIGSSGAVMGFFTAFALYFPESIIYLLIPPIPLKAKKMLLLWIVVELILGLFQIFNWFTPFVNFGGIITGFLLVRYWQKNSKSFY